MKSTCIIWRILFNLLKPIFDIIISRAKYSSLDMSDSDSELDAPLTRVLSTERPKETGYDVSPEDTDYEIHVTDRKKSRFLYTLKKGKELPYHTVLEGKNKLDLQSLGTSPDLYYTVI